MSKEKKERLQHEAEAGAAGAVAGAAIGAIAGPPGAAVGAVIGAVAGALADSAVETDSENRAAEEEKLDEEIGVEGGELGAPNLKHPKAKVGAYSGASSGGSPRLGSSRGIAAVTVGPAGRWGVGAQCARLLAS